MNRRGKWLTAVSGDGVGWPDAVLLRANRLVVAELKTKRNKPTPEQDNWLLAFRNVGAEVHVWKPADWNEIVEVLA